MTLSPQWPCRIPTNIPGPLQPKSPPSGAEPDPTNWSTPNRRILALQNTLAQLAQLLAHGFVVVQLVRLHQDVADMNWLMMTWASPLRRSFSLTM